MEVLYIYPVSSKHSLKNPKIGIQDKRKTTHRGQSHVGNDDGVKGAGGVTKRLVLVAVGVVLVLVDLAVLRGAVPGHGGLADTDVALGGDGGGLAAEVPILREDRGDPLAH